jgi:anti-anti-sigma factor
MAVGSELEVYSLGKLTVLGFGGRPMLDHLNVAECRDWIVDLIKANGIESLAFDLTGVVVVPSGFLGLLASLRKVGPEVLLFNVCDDIREVLEITHLDRMLTIHQVEV